MHCRVGSRRRAHSRQVPASCANGERKVEEPPEICGCFPHYIDWGDLVDFHARLPVLPCVQLHELLVLLCLLQNDAVHALRRRETGKHW